MANVILEEKYILEYIKTLLNEYRVSTREVKNAKFHHNTDYEYAASVCRNGILTLNDLVSKKVFDYDEKQMQVFADIESHANGIDGISLSIPGMTDLYIGEWEYDPFEPKHVDFLVSSDIVAGRSAVNYGNEYITRNSISIDKLRAVDVRLLELIKMYEARDINTENIKTIINKYNSLKDIALAMKETKLDIPFREMSKTQIEFDIDKLSKTPKLLLK